MDNRENDLSRRAFVETLAIGSVAGASAVTSTGCAGLLPSVQGAGAVGAFDGAAFLARLEAGLAHLERVPILETALGAKARTLGVEARGFLEENEAMAKRAIRSLYIAGFYRDLPPEGRADVRLEARKQELAAELDLSVSETTAMLASLTPEAHADVRRTLETRPDLLTRTFDVLGERSAALEVPFGSRARLRAAASEITFRLQRQPPELLIQECVGKVERLAARSGLELVVTQRAAAQAMQEAFWSDGGATDSTPLAATSSVTGPAPSEPAPASKESAPSRRPGDDGERSEDRPGSGTIKTGAIIGGVGLAVFGLGGIIVAAGAFPGVFLMTAGVILALVSLVTMIVGLIIRAAKSPKDEPSGASSSTRR